MTNTKLSRLTIYSCLILMAVFGISQQSQAQTWTITDVGTHTQSSTPTLSGAKEISVVTYGQGVGATSDNFTYVSQEVEGDLELVARIVSISNGLQDTQSGLMLRTSLDAGSPFVQVVLTGSGDVIINQRENENESVTVVSTATALSGSLPLWLRLKSVGTLITASQSVDGTSWQQVGSVSLASVGKADWGLVSATGDVNGTAATTINFDKVSLITNIPQITSRMRLWLRADDGLTYNTQGRVSSWMDHSSYGNNVTQAATANQPTWSLGQSGEINEMPFVKFDAVDQFLSVADNISLKPLSNVRVYTVVRRNSGTGIAIVLEKYTSGSSGYSLQMQTASGRRFYTNGATTSGTVSSGATDFALLEGFLEIPGSRTVKVNGTILAESSTISSTIGASSQPFYLGGRGTNYSLVGDIAEVLIFGDDYSNAYMEEAEIKTVEAYLHSKYDIIDAPKASQPIISSKTGIYSSGQTISISAAPGYEIYYRINNGAEVLYTSSFVISTTSTVSAFSRKIGHQDSDIAESAITIDPQSYRVAAADLALWLRSDVGVEESGGLVHLWKDQSPLGNDAFQDSSSNRPALVENQIEGKPVIRFNTAAKTFLQAPATDSDKVSVIAVIKNSRLSGTTTHVVAERLNAATPSGYSLYLSSYVGRGFRVNSGTSTVSVPSSESIEFSVLEGIYDRVQRKLFYNNGALSDADNQTAAAGTPAKPVYIGGRGAANNMEGDIAELLIYNRDLNATERQNLAIYLYERYRIGSAPEAPIASVPTGVYTSSQSVELTFAQPGVTIRYTLDGSTPNALSTEYTGPIEITETTTLKAFAEISPSINSYTSEWVYVVDNDSSNYVSRSGLELWLRSDAGVDSANGVVSKWTDVGGTNQSHVAVSLPGTSPVLNNSVISFDAGNFLGISNHADLNPSRLSIFTVVRPKQGGTVNPGGVLAKHTSTSGYFISTSGTDLVAGINGTLAESSSEWPWENGYQILGSSFDTNNDVNLFSNGVKVATTHRTSGITTSTNNLYIGKGSDPTKAGPFEGDIAEILMYSRAVTDVERREIEAYLSHKHGIDEAIPVIEAPVIEVGAGSTGLSRSVTVSSSEPGAVIRYTQDGTNPTESSPIYYSPVAVYESLTFKARAFKPYFNSLIASSDIEINKVWSGVHIGGTETIDNDPSWTFAPVATGQTNQSDNLHYIYTSCFKGGSIEWKSSRPATGMLGIMMRVDPGEGEWALSASAFVGFKNASSGDSNCYFISRAASGLEEIKTQIVPNVSPGDFLKLELVGNTVVVLTKNAATPQAEWTRHWGIDLFQNSNGRLLGIDMLDENGLLIDHALMGIAASKNPESSAQEINISDADFTLKYRDEGARWLRAVEPSVGALMPNIGKFARQGVNYNTQFSYGGWTLQSASPIGSYTSGDIVTASVTADEISAVLTDINCPTSSALDVYIRLANTGVSGQTINIIVEQRVTVGITSTLVETNTFSKSLDVDNGLWVYLGKMSDTDGAERKLSIKLTNVVNGSYAATAVNLDAFLLVADSSAQDIDQDNIPDNLSPAVGEFSDEVKIPFVPWGDANGDGWSNYQQLILGAYIDGSGFAKYNTALTLGEWRTVDVVKVGDNLDFVYGAIGHYTDDLSLLATYSGSSEEVVPGYAISFKRAGVPQPGSVPGVQNSAILLLSSPNSVPLFAADGANSAEARNYYTFTGQDGRATCRVYTSEEALSGMMVEIDAYKNDPSEKIDDWFIATYKNDAPGPIRVEATSWKMGLSGQTTVSQSSTAAPIILVKGPFMAVGHPLETLSANPNEGYVDLMQWDPREGAWLPSITIQAPSSAGGKFGRTLDKVIINSKEYLAIGGLTAICFYEMTSDRLCELEPEMILDLSTYTLGDWSCVAFGNNQAAIGDSDYSGTATNAGRVLIFQCEVITGVAQWNLAQVIAPSSGKHSDLFGTSLAFSPDGTHLAVGAPSDLLWHQDPNNGPYWDDVEGVDVYPETPGDPSVYIYAWNSPNWTLDEKISVQDLSCLFGQSLLFTSDDELLVGAPFQVYGEDMPPIQHGPGYVQLYTHDQNGWTSSSTLTQDNPGFGGQIRVSGGRLFSRVPLLYDVSELLYPESIQVFDLPWGSSSHSEALYPTTEVSSIAADGAALFMVSAGVMSQYDLMPSVAATATSGSVATLQVEDANISTPTVYNFTTNNPAPFVDEVDLNLLNSSSMFELLEETTTPPDWPEYSLNVKSGANMSHLAGSVAWLQLSARDLAGDSYEEAIGIRILGEVPEAPTNLYASVIGRNKILIGWDPLVVMPDTYIVEGATLVDFNAANGDPALEDLAFSEIRKPSGWIHSIHEDVTMGNGAMVYRVKAENNEGTSAASSLVTILFDSDGDGLPDWWEMLYAGNLTSLSGSSSDYDSDGRSDLSEYNVGTNPFLADSDFDGVNDLDDEWPNDQMYNGVHLILHTPLEKSW